MLRLSTRSLCPRRWMSIAPLGYRAAIAPASAIADNPPHPLEYPSELPGRQAR
jgi:hypothetical protein